MKRKVFELSSTIEDGEDVNPSFTFEGQSDKFDGIGPVNVVRVRCPKQFGVLEGSEGKIADLAVAPWKQPSEAIQNYNNVLFALGWERYPWFESSLATTTGTNFNNTDSRNAVKTIRAFGVSNETNSTINARIRLYVNKDLSSATGNNVPGTGQFVFFDKTITLAPDEAAIIGPHDFDRGEMETASPANTIFVSVPRYSKYTMCSVVDADTNVAFTSNNVLYELKALATKYTDNTGANFSNPETYSSMPSLSLTTGNVIKYEVGTSDMPTVPMPSPLFDDLAMKRLGFVGDEDNVMIGVRGPIFNDVQRLIMDLNPSTQKIVSRHSKDVDTQVLYDHASITFTTDDDPTDNSLYAIYSQASDFNTNALFNETGMTDSYAYRLQRFLFDLKTGTTVTQPLVLPLPFNFVEVKAVMDETGAEPQTKQEVLPSQQSLIPPQRRLLPGVPTPEDMRG